MNGVLTRKWRGRATRSHTILSLRSGSRLDVSAGDLFDVLEDHYGNTYVHDETGAEHFVQDVEPVEEASDEWFPDGLRERIAYLTKILDRTERPVEGEHRSRLAAQLAAALAALAETDEAMTTRRSKRNPESG